MDEISFQISKVSPEQTKDGYGIPSFLFDPSKRRAPIRWFMTCLSLFLWHVRLSLDEPIEESDEDE